MIPVYDELGNFLGWLPRYVAEDLTGEDFDEEDDVLIME